MPGVPALTGILGPGIFVDPSFSTCTCAEKCDISTFPSEIFLPQNDSMWIWNCNAFA